MNAKAVPSPKQDNAAAFEADVDAHVPADPIPVEASGQHFTLAPMRVKQFFPFLKAARPIFAALVTMSSSLRSVLPPDAGSVGQGGEPTEAKAGTSDLAGILDLVDKHGEDLVKALAIGIAPTKPDKAAWDASIRDTQAAIDELPVVDMIMLVRRFVEVNAGFFVDRGLTLPPGLLTNAGVAASQTSKAS